MSKLTDLKYFTTDTYYLKEFYKFANSKLTSDENRVC